MSTIAKDDEVHIRLHPLTLDHDAFIAFSANDGGPAKTGVSLERVDSLNRRDAISNLLGTLQIHPVAKRLKYLQRPVNGQLATIYAQTQSETFDLSPFTPLAKLVADKADDLEIWRVVLQLIADLSRSTPPLSSIPPSFSGTPLRHSSASFRDSNQRREDLRKHILAELSGRTYEDVPEFITKYFADGKPWSGRVDRILEELPANNPLEEFPDTSKPEEADFWAWLNAFQEQHLVDAPNKFHRAESKSNITGATGERQFDVFLKSRAVPPVDIHHLADCLMVGELTTKDTSVWKAKFAQLATYMRDVFFAQPTRRFVHGFLIFGVQMQLWVFDRSGAYSSVKFNIHQHPQQFIRVLVGYAWMSAEELGLDIFVQRRGLFPSVTLLDPVTGEKREFHIKEKPFFHLPAIACRGTTCYLTPDEKYVVKFSWRPDKPQAEVDHLTKAQGIRGVPRLVGASTITTIKDLRSDLKIKKLRNLGYTVHEKSTDLSHLSFIDSTNQLEGLSMSGTKRKGGQRGGSPTKRSRSNTQRSVLGQEVQPSELENQQAPTMPPPNSPQRNRVLTCLAIAPAGRPLQDFRSVCEVLKAFRDAIKAHQELFVDRHILHRDISHGNIILTDPDQADGCSGMLIDYDLAVQVGTDGKNETSEEKTMTGTLDFIAIEVLEGAMQRDKAGIERTYRHDLESFFYVLLALCIRHGWEQGTKPKPDVLQAWYDDSYGHIARTKRGDMGAKGLEVSLLSNFSPSFESFKALARRLRDILFGKGDLNTETPSDPNTLYKPMIAAFEDAIQDFEYYVESQHDVTSTVHHNSQSPRNQKRKAFTDDSNTSKRRKQKQEHQPRSH